MVLVVVHVMLNTLVNFSKWPISNLDVTLVFVE